MIYNPYAKKKRPRPAGWTTTSTTTSTTNISSSMNTDSIPGILDRPPSRHPSSVDNPQHTRIHCVGTGTVTAPYNPATNPPPPRRTSDGSIHNTDRITTTTTTPVPASAARIAVNNKNSLGASDSISVAAGAATTTTSRKFGSVHCRPFQPKTNPYAKNAPLPSGCDTNPNHVGRSARLSPTAVPPTVVPGRMNGNPGISTHELTATSITNRGANNDRTPASSIASSAQILSTSTSTNHVVSRNAPRPNNLYAPQKKPSHRNEADNKNESSSSSSDSSRTATQQRTTTRHGIDARNTVLATEASNRATASGHDPCRPPLNAPGTFGDAAIAPKHSLGKINATTSTLPSRMASIRPASWQKAGVDRGRSLDAAIINPANSAANPSRPKSLLGPNKSSDQHPPRADEESTDALPQELAYTPDQVKPVRDQYRMPLIKNARLSEPLPNGWTLFPHQKKAVIRALTMRRMILALDMGLGKTLIGALWCRAFRDTFGRDKLKTYVICPVSLKEEWRRTAEETVGLAVEDEQASNRKPSKKRKSTSQNRGSQTQTEGGNGGNNDLKVSICSWAKVPKAVESCVEHFVVCCDEAHAMQSTQSQRTRDVLTLVDDKRCVGVLLLTGTPMKNGKPGNLFPLLKAVRHPLGRHQKAYETHFCNGMLKNFGRGAQWDATGASNLDQLKRKVASNLLHMTKEQCLQELPPMTKILHDVPVSSRYQVQYEHSIKYLANVQANSSNMRGEAVLGAVQRLRVVCAAAKVDATVEMARSILDKEPAVVIFTSFAQVAKTIHSKLVASRWQCGLLTGETPQKKRQELVDDFQNGLSAVFVCTFGAGGVGLTLTAASTIILLDRPWTPGETRQAEDRIRRIGQARNCTSYWIRSFDLDRQIDEMLESKKQTANAVLDRSGNQNTSPDGTSARKISINQLVHKFVLADSRKKL